MKKWPIKAYGNAYRVKKKHSLAVLFPCEKMTKTESFV